MGIWPAARTSNGRLCACCVMDCWPVRWCGLRRPAVGTQVMALQLGSSRTQHFPSFEKSVSRQLFWPFETTAINLDSILCLLKFPVATFDGGHVCSSQPNILKTYAPLYICTRSPHSQALHSAYTHAPIPCMRACMLLMSLPSLYHTIR